MVVVVVVVAVVLELVVVAVELVCVDVVTVVVVCVVVVGLSGSQPRSSPVRRETRTSFRSDVTVEQWPGSIAKNPPGTFLASQAE